MNPQAADLQALARPIFDLDVAAPGGHVVACASPIAGRVCDRSDEAVSGSGE
jgi:hypothetical protein